MEYKTVSIMALLNAPLAFGPWGPGYSAPSSRLLV
jgi:hypothetical protein